MRKTRLLIPVLLLVALLSGSAPAVTSSVFKSVDLSDDLLLRFDFDGRSADDTILDESSSGIDGVYVDKGTTDPNYSDGSLQFSKDSGYVAIESDERRLVKDFTITARVRNPYQNYHAGIVSSEKWRLVAPYGRYEFTAGNAGVGYDGAAHGEWHDIAVVRRNDTVHLYVDGAFVESARITGNLSTERILIGKRPDGYPYEGQIDEVAIYERSLSEAEIRGYFAGERNVRPVFYSDVFRMVSPFGIVLIAILVATLEVRFRKHA